MKKTIGKPENWQDFESLCKKLWGEIWEIPNKIKKNGRLGQEQAGVDVYGIPKNHNKYWGIQAKGKDDYVKAKLSNKEIDSEIQKAKLFKPNLDVYIIATTQNKDSKIEEYVRLKDIENRKSGSFEILLFCWEDIVDLLENNQSTHRWYLDGINQEGRFNFKISFNDFNEQLILSPIFKKNITKFEYIDKSNSEILNEKLTSFKSITQKLDSLFPLSSNTINKSWCSFDFIMENIGSRVIEDWRVKIKFLEGVRSISNGNSTFSTLSLTEYIDDDLKTIDYSPLKNNPLIQKDNCYFNLSILPELDSEKIIFEWELLARDFNKKDETKITIQPQYIENIELELVNDKKIREDDIYVSYHIE